MAGASGVLCSVDFMEKAGVSAIYGPGRHPRSAGRNFSHYGPRLSVRRSLDWPEGIQCVFGVSNNAVPIIDQYLFVEVDPLPQKGQIVRIEPASYYPDRGTEVDSDHLGRSNPRSAGDFDPDIVPRTASLRNKHDERQPGALGPQISHFVRGLAFRLGIGTTWFRRNLFAGRRGDFFGAQFHSSGTARTSLVGQRRLRRGRRRRRPSRRRRGIGAQHKGYQTGPTGLVRGPEAAAGIAMEELVEQDIIAEVRVVLFKRRVAENRPMSVLAAQEDAA